MINKKQPESNDSTSTDESLLGDKELIPHEQNTPASSTLSLFEQSLSSSSENDSPLTVFHTDSTVGFRRGNTMISVSRLSVAQRRLMDVVFFIVSQKPDLHPAYEQYVIKKGTTYQVDFDLIRWLAALPSQRKDNYARVMKGMHTAEFNFQVELDGKDKKADHKRDFMYSVILASIGIVDKGERVKFTINPDFIEILENQHLYKDNHFLNLCYNMPNLSSKQLYDWLLVRMARLKGNSLDVKITVDEFKEEVLMDKSVYPRFSDLNRYVLATAVKGVNEHSHYETEIEHLRLAKTSQVTHLRIRAKLKNPVDGESLNSSLELMIRLRIEFGLTKSDIEEILKNKTTWTDEYIDRATRYVMYYHKKVGVESFRGYLMNCLRKGYVIGQGVGLLDEAAVNEASNEAVSFSDQPLDLSAYPDVIKEVKEVFKQHEKEYPPSAETKTQQELNLLPPAGPKSAQDNNRLTQDQITKGLTLYFQMSETNRAKILESYSKWGKVMILIYSNPDWVNKWQQATDEERLVIILENESLKELFVRMVLEEKQNELGGGDGN